MVDLSPVCAEDARLQQLSPQDVRRTGARHGVDVSAPRLTGSAVHGYTLSGWRRDKHGHYRVWLSVNGTMHAASLRHGTLAAPKPPTGRQRPSWLRASIRLGDLKETKARADLWLAAKIAEVTK